MACVLYALYPQFGYVSALLIGFLLGAEFDVLAFLIKRYYGNAAYGRVYGVIFGVFYLGSAVGIWGLPKLRELSADLSYDNGLYAAAVILAASAILMPGSSSSAWRPRRTVEIEPAGSSLATAVVTGSTMRSTRRASPISRNRRIAATVSHCATLTSRRWRVALRRRTSCFPRKSETAVRFYSRNCAC